jgi:hypothetical protein
MSMKELGYCVVLGACFLMLLGAIAHVQFLIGAGVFTIVGWFIGVWRQSRRAETRQH